MSNLPDRLRDRLLDQQIPDSGNLAQYQKEIRAMLERQEQVLRCERWYSAAAWCLVVALCVIFSLAAGYGPDKPSRVYFSIGVTLLIITVGGATELLKYFINRARLEVTRDIKGLELRILELEGLLRGKTQ